MIILTYETVTQAAARLGCCRRNVLTMIASGRLHGCVRFGKAWQVPVEAMPDPPRKPGAKKREIIPVGTQVKPEPKWIEQ